MVNDNSSGTTSFFGYGAIFCLIAAVLTAAGLVCESDPQMAAAGIPLLVVGAGFIALGLAFLFLAFLRGELTCSSTGRREQSPIALIGAIGVSTFAGGLLLLILGSCGTLFMGADSKLLTDNAQLGVTLVLVGALTILAAELLPREMFKKAK